MEGQTLAIERLLAALIMEAGGEIRVQYDSIVAAHGPNNRYLVMDIVEDGTALALTLAESDEVPEDVR